MKAGKNNVMMLLIVCAMLLTAFCAAWVTAVFGSWLSDTPADAVYSAYCPAVYMILDVAKVVLCGYGISIFLPYSLSQGDGSH